MVMLLYYIPIIYLLELVFYPSCKLYSLTMCLKNYYNFLDLEVDVHSIIFNIKFTFYLLYDEYVKFMVQILILMFNKMSLKLNLLH